MNVLLDAWLDCANPRLRIIDRETGAELFRWDGVQLSSAMENGLICAADFEKQPVSAKELLNIVACMGG